MIAFAVHHVLFKILPLGCAVGYRGIVRTRREAILVSSHWLEDEMRFEAELFADRAYQLLVQDKGVHELGRTRRFHVTTCLLYTSDAADERSSVDLGGR